MTGRRALRPLDIVILPISFLKVSPTALRASSSPRAYVSWSLSEHACSVSLRVLSARKGRDSTDPWIPSVRCENAVEDVFMIVL
jgi:hypothetical protein